MTNLLGDIKLGTVESWSTMANQMLEEVFRNSHPDLVGMELSPSTPETEKENDAQINNCNEGENNASSLVKPSSFKQGTLPSRKSVEFAVLPAPKRVRLAPEWTFKQAIEGECYSCHRLTFCPYMG